ncbi:MAG: hypothetical protein KKI09_03000 [Spirochaetes bacterium]|nr:hypothetical protein [Spirochaetota bacterium]
MKHTFSFVLLLSGLLCLPLPAQTVEIVLIENDALSSPRTLVLSEWVINGGLDALFNAGLIATNQRPVAGTRDDFLSVKPSFETLEASIDYLFIVFAQYQNDQVTKLARLDWRIMQVRSREVIKEGSLAAAAAAGVSAEAVEKACTQSGIVLIQAGLPALGL